MANIGRQRKKFEKKVVKTFKRGDITERLTRAVSSTALVGGGYLTWVLHSPFPVVGGIAIAIVAKKTLGPKARKVFFKVVRKCVGRPELAEAVAKQIKDKYTKKFIINLGKRKKLTRTEKDALDAIARGKFTRAQKNIVKRMAE